MQRINENCVICHQSGTVSLIVEQSYAHVFYLPFFPLKKRIYSHCEFCKQVHLEHEMPVQYANYCHLVKPMARKPLWMWSGLLLCGFLLVIGSYLGQQNDDKNLTLMRNPSPGQIYEWRMPEGQYTVSRITGVKADSVCMQFSLLSTNKISGLTQLRQAGKVKFREDTTVFSKKELLRKLDEREIIDIIQD